MSKPIRRDNLNSLMQKMEDEIKRLNRVLTSPPVIKRPIFELGFADYGDQSFGPVEYWRDISGVVHVSGLVQKTTPWAFGEPVFRFEEGYRPKKDIIIPSICDQQFERLNVNRNGWLINSRLVSTAGLDSWLSVNFSFPTF